MPYDDTRFSHWDEPDDDNEEFDASMICDIVGICEGCGQATFVNVLSYCEYCMDDFEEG